MVWGQREGRARRSGSPRRGSCPCQPSSTAPAQQHGTRRGLHPRGPESPPPAGLRSAAVRDPAETPPPGWGRHGRTPARPEGLRAALRGGRASAASPRRLAAGLASLQGGRGEPRGPQPGGRALRPAAPGPAPPGVARDAVYDSFPYGGAVARLLLGGWFPVATGDGVRV